MMKSFIGALAAFLVLIAFYSSCNKNTIARPQTLKTTQPGTALSVTPENGIVNSTITITGKGFDTVMANNIVKFNGITATIAYSTATKIVASVPAGASTGQITVTTNGKTVTVPATFRVLHLVKTDSIAQPMNGSQPNAITCLVFDKTGNMYGIQGLNTGSVIVKFANGSLSGALSVFYKAPKDSTVIDSSYCSILVTPGGEAITCQSKIYTYSLTAAVADNNNDIYVSQQFSLDTPNNRGYGQVNTTSILKITPSGQVTTLANIPRPISSMAIDPAGNIYFADRPLPDIYKVTPGGAVSIFALVSNHYIASVGADKSGNEYAIYNDPSTDGNDDLLTLAKFTPQGAASTITGPTIYPYGFFSSMFFDADGNLVTANDNNILLINPAGFVTRLQATGIDNIFTDTAGNWYEESEFYIVKYSLQ